MIFARKGAFHLWFGMWTVNGSRCYINKAFPLCNVRYMLMPVSCVTLKFSYIDV